MELLQTRCPACQSQEITEHMTYETKQNGARILYRCQACQQVFSETKNTLLAGIRTSLSTIWQVLEARTHGMGLNAAAEVFKTAKNTILDWERKFAQLHQVFLV